MPHSCTNKTWLIVIDENLAGEGFASQDRLQSAVGIKTVPLQNYWLKIKGQTPIQTLTIAVDDTADQSCVDGFPVALLLDKLKYCIGHLFVQRSEQALSPCDQSKLKQESVSLQNCLTNQATKTKHEFILHIYK